MTIQGTCEVCGCLRECKVVDRLSAHDVVQCEVCGLIFVHPLPSVAQVASFYAAATYEPPMAEAELARWSRSKSREFEELIDFGRLDTLPRTAAILDVGCSTGATLEMLQSLGFLNIRGLEIDPATAQFTSRRLGIPVDVGGIDGLPSEIRFDVIWFGDSLEHMREPRRALENAYARLRPGGRVLVRCPNTGGLVMRASRLAKRAGIFRNWLTLETPLHLFHFTPKTLSALLQSVGFEAVSWRVLPLRFWYFSRLRRRDWMELRGQRASIAGRLLVQRILWAPLYFFAHGTGLVIRAGDAMIVGGSKPPRQAGADQKVAMDRAPGAGAE